MNFSKLNVIQSLKVDKLTLTLLIKANTLIALSGTYDMHLQYVSKAEPIGSKPENFLAYIPITHTNIGSCQSYIV